MKLFHGSNVDFSAIDIRKCKPYKDFGQGFYLTDIYAQAEAMARRKVQIMGGTSIVQVYELQESQLESIQLNVLRFEKPTKEWAEFIYQNRCRHKAVFHHDYDIVIGPIADDGVAYLLNRYEEGSFTLEELAKELEYKKLNRQFFFGTASAVQLLKRVL